MARHVSAREARAHFAELTDRVRYTGEPVILEKQGKPCAALVSMRDYEEIDRRRREENLAANARYAADWDDPRFQPDAEELAIVEEVRRDREEWARKTYPELYADE
ncbi:MAG TPA: type II toxin-antitoxin system Phd/YefM family antitoxin [Chloroflexota bacterium]|nr:type II toxin-antitoxin system Phd/YefM family antitoxin [Chloroflexota bacterium]